MNNLQEKVIRAMVDMYGFYSIEELSEMTEISISSIKRSCNLVPVEVLQCTCVSSISYSVCQQLPA